jgi:hypothetical protein
MIGKSESRGLYAALGIMLAAYLSACEATTSPTAIDAQLRVINVGSRELEDLVVLFPHQRVEFGSLAAGFATPYRVVPDGVFRYAAYEFRVGGRVQHQPVIDWVGEEPMEGRAFTYSIELVNTPSSGLTIRLVSTRRDH